MVEEFLLGLTAAFTLESGKTASSMGMAHSQTEWKILGQASGREESENVGPMKTRSLQLRTAMAQMAMARVSQSSKRLSKPMRQSKRQGSRRDLRKTVYLEEE